MVTATLSVAYPGGVSLVAVETTFLTKLHAVQATGRHVNVNCIWVLYLLVHIAKLFIVRWLKWSMSTRDISSFRLLLQWAQNDKYSTCTCNVMHYACVKMCTWRLGMQCWVLYTHGTRFRSLSHSHRKQWQTIGWYTCFEWNVLHRHTRR